MTGFNSKRDAAADKLQEREALKLALGALDSENPDIQCRAALAIRAALAQPAQEPLAYSSVAYKLAQKELGRLVAENFGRMPKDKWADSVLDLRDHLEAQPAQEPVAQGSKEHLKIMMEHSAWDDRLELSDALANIDEFYATSPPKREWVGLTPEETSGFTQHEMTVVKYVSKVLQEKNG